MTDQEINIAIAESVGRCAHKDTEYYCIEDGNSYDSGFKCKKCGKDIAGDSVPNYCSDLNAMHEVEKGLKDTLAITYQEEIRQAIKLHNLEGNVAWIFMAPARQRAEAYLKTIGKWKETTPTP